MRYSEGFTLVELLVTVAILVLLVKMAAPSFANLVQSANVSSSVNTFLADLRFARSEAVRRGSMVVMCRSNSPEAASPTCGTGSGPGGNGWVSGWLVFVDRDNSNSYNSGDQLLRVQAAISGIDSMVEGGASSSTKFEFTPLGRQRSVGNATQLQFGSTIPSERQRVVCINPAGRARIAGNGFASCTGSDS
ncbi:MAG: GspH/FimT family pseudopilin [Burkholderiales bacterium]|nr:GspH/FimT family pseudopilin [Burkholderiales bacterium]